MPSGGCQVPSGDVVGEVVGTFVIEGTAYVLDAGGTGQAIDDFEDINASDRTNGAFHLLAANLRGATIGGLSLPGVEDPDPVLLRSSYLDHIGVIRTQYGPERDAVLQPLVRREFNNDMTQIIGFRWITAVYQQASDRRYIDPERPPVVFDQNN